MRHIKLYYSIAMFVLTSLMLLMFPICKDAGQYSLIGFLLVMGYTTSITVFTWWRDERKQDNGPFYDSAGYTEADRKKMKDIEYWTADGHIKTFKNIEGLYDDSEKEIL